MSTAFAAAEQRLGRAAAARLGNASARFNGSDQAIDGVFSNPSVVSGVGQAGAYARMPQFGCLVADLVGQNVANRIAITLDTPGATAAWYVVKDRLPDDVHAGWAVFLLEPAP